MLIGLTGGMGAGKSTALQCFQKLGIPTRSADAIVHKIYKEDFSVKKQLINYFGQDIIENNTIIRARLAEIVFQDDEKLTWLNNLIHPIIKKKILEKTDKITIIEIPLLFEKNWQKYFLKTIAIWRQPCLIENSSQGIIRDKERRSKQYSQNTKLNLADYGLINNSSIEDLHKQCKNILIKFKNSKI